MAAYRAEHWMPPLVAEALRAAERIGFPHSCSAEVGRLLAVLARRVHRGPIGEVGTGCGVGAAWLASGKPEGVPLYTAELDPALAEEARRALAGAPDVRVLEGDWHQLLAYAPFELLFADTKAKEHEPERLVEGLAPGGLAVLDDMTPVEHWPPEWRGRKDPVREFWLNDPRLLATEVRVTATSAVILAVRVG